MAVTAMYSFDAQAISVDNVGFQFSPTYSTATKRTGLAAVRCDPASAATRYVDLLSSGNYLHFAINVATLPSVDRTIAGFTGAGKITVRLTSTGALAVYINTTLVGTSSTTLTTGTWYWIGVRQVTGTTVAFLQIDGINAVTGTATVTDTSNFVGFADAQSSAVDAYFDDVIVDSVGFLAPSKVALLLPTANSAVGTGWVGGAGGAASFNAVDNTPPVGVADTGTDISQIRNATAAANSNYDATMTTYSAAGVNTGDTVLAVDAIVATAAPVTTSSKQGTVGVASNPTIANIALAAGGTAGAFWSGAAGGVYPIGWKISHGTFTTSPSVTVGTAPVMRITQVTSSTRIAMVCFMGMNVAWTPAAVVANPPHRNPMPPLIAQ